MREESMKRTWLLAAPLLLLLGTRALSAADQNQADPTGAKAIPDHTTEWQGRMP
jgi:hypothetical protein